MRVSVCPGRLRLAPNRAANAPLEADSHIQSRLAGHVHSLHCVAALLAVAPLRDGVADCGDSGQKHFLRSAGSESKVTSSSSSGEIIFHTIRSPTGGRSGALVKARRH